MAEFTPLSFSHLIIATITIALIVFLPYFYIHKADRSKKTLIITLILLMIINHVMDFIMRDTSMILSLVYLFIYVTSHQPQ